MPQGRPYTREEVIIAYALYCVIPFSKLSNNNQTIKTVAEKIGRSPASLKMKICNLAALDPTFLSSGRVSLWGSNSKLNREVYEEFSNDWQRLSDLAEDLVGLPIFDLETPVYNGPEKKMKKTYAEIADKQARRFFRKSVLAAYEGCCCISGMRTPELLIASHIKPYAESDRSERANPANGLLLNAFYDRAFDQGLMTVLPDLTIKISEAVDREHADEKTREWLLGIEGTKIKRPSRFAPNRDFLAFHNERIFIR